VSYRSAPADLAPHGVRTLGFASASRIAARYGLNDVAVGESLLDFEASGWGRQVELRDSCHTVWIQFHEDLLATLGIPRDADG
jgi:hypothetical protein